MTVLAPEETDVVAAAPTVVRARAVAELRETRRVWLLAQLEEPWSVDTGAMERVSGWPSVVAKEGSD